MILLKNLPDYQLEAGTYQTVDPTAPGAEKVYRFFNPSTGLHLYTTSEVERDFVIDNLDNFEYEDVKFYAYKAPETEEDSTLEGSIPIYRFYEPSLGVHFYTPDEGEKDSVIENLANYNFENIAYYALPSVSEIDV